MRTTSFLTKRPAIGEFNHRVILRKRVDYPMANQGIESEYPEQYERWASIAPIGTAAYLGSIQIDNGLATITHRIKIRFMLEIDTSFEVVHKNSVYRIKRVVHQLGENRFSILECEEIIREQQY